MGGAGEIAGHDKGACWVSVVRKTDTLRQTSFPDAIQL
jgi:hypothetical protein